MFDKNEMILDRVRSLSFNTLDTRQMLFRLTSLEDSQLSCTAEGEEITDAIGSLITTLYRAKKASFTANNSLFSLTLLAEQYGATKEVATEMAKTLRGCPIVGYFKEEQQDFRDHGEQVVMDESGIHFNCLTTPYGFVAPDAKIWFQEFEDTDQFGNVTTREYLMTTGFLWTGQFPEIKEAVDEGRPQ